MQFVTGSDDELELACGIASGNLFMTLSAVLDPISVQTVYRVCLPALLAAADTMVKAMFTANEVLLDRARTEREELAKRGMTYDESVFVPIKTSTRAFVDQEKAAGRFPHYNPQSGDDDATR